MNQSTFGATVRKAATVEHLVDLVMIVFALASIGNVSEYMVKAGHNVVTAYGVGIALGLGLVAISIMLARVPTDDKRTFASMLSATLAVGLLSGTVQALAYYDHSANVWTACLKGYGFPLVGECLLAVAMAMHTSSERKRRSKLADDGMEERINDAISDALATIDIGGMQGYIEQQAGLILKHKMAEIVARRTGQLPAPMIEKVVVTPIVAETMQGLPETVDISGHIEDISTGSRFVQSEQQTSESGFAERMAAAKAAKKVQRQGALLSILMTEFNGQPSDALDKSAIADRIGATSKTVGRDIEELIAANRLAVNGHIEVLSN